MKCIICKKREAKVIDRKEVYGEVAKICYICDEAIFDKQQKLEKDRWRKDRNKKWVYKNGPVGDYYDLE